MATTTFPYTGEKGLTQLEQVLPGFQFTELEAKVAGNPSFQHLRRTDFTNWSEGATGLKYEWNEHGGWEHSFYESKVDNQVVPPLTPSAIGKLFDVFAPHFRSVLVLTAVITREFNQSEAKNQFDQELVRDLCAWMQTQGGHLNHGFRWERHYTFLQNQAHEQEWNVQAAELTRGTSDVIVLLIDSLPPAQQQGQRDRIYEAVRSVQCLTDEKNWNWMSRRYFPRVDCQICSQQAERGGHDRNCRNIPVIIVADSGNVSRVKSWLDPNLRRKIKSVRFKVPCSTFRKGDRWERQIYPSLAVFTVDQLEQPDKDEALRLLTDWVAFKQQEERNRGLWSEYKPTSWQRTQVIIPAGSSRLNTILIAGPVIEINLFWKEAFDGSNWQEFVANGMTVSYTHS